MTPGWGNIMTLTGESFWPSTDVTWESFTGDQSDNGGTAGPTRWIKNFLGAPVADAYYPVALAEMLSQSNLNQTESEIKMKLNANASWYYETAGFTPNDNHDLVTLVLHELAHGLGFVSNAYQQITQRSDGSIVDWGFWIRTENLYPPPGHYSGPFSYLVSNF